MALVFLIIGVDFSTTNTKAELKFNIPNTK